MAYWACPFSDDGVGKQGLVRLFVHASLRRVPLLVFPAVGPSGGNVVATIGVTHLLADASFMTRVGDPIYFDVDVFV